MPSNEIEIAVHDGWVTLSGKVQTYHQKKAAEDDIHKLAGVRGITNNVLIRPVPSAIDIQIKIESALKRRAMVNAHAVRVTVNAPGNVILEGTVDNWHERLAVENLPGLRRAWSTSMTVWLSHTQG